MLSATIIVRPSGVMTLPLGNRIPVTAEWIVPSGSTRAIVAPS